VNQQLLNTDFVEHIFTVFESRFRNLWVDSLGGLSRTQVKNQWFEDLQDLSEREIRRGLDASKSLEYPPTLGKFRNLCRPPIDYSAMFEHAITQLRLRQEGRDQWVNSAVYWAAVKTSYEIRTYPYDRVKETWKRNLDAAYKAVREGLLPHEVPKAALALPAPGRTQTNIETGRERIKKILEMFDVDAEKGSEAIE
jgi:hypothetical protein